MDSMKTCAGCGEPLAANAPGGLCPRCRTASSDTTPLEGPPIILTEEAGDAPRPIPPSVGGPALVRGAAAKPRSKVTIGAWVLGAAALLAFLGFLAVLLWSRIPGEKPSATTETGRRDAKLSRVPEIRPPAPLPPEWTNAAAFASAANILFPTDAGVVDVSQPPYHAKGDGAMDDTATIQQALDDHPDQHAIIYLPNGTYLVSETLRWGEGRDAGPRCRRTVLQGQSRDGTIIKLKDACPGYTDPAAPMAVIWTGPEPAERYRNAVRNLTIDTGRDNPGAIGLQFNANYVGCVRDVLIRSGDGQGAIGLDMSYVKCSGPLLVKNLVVRGFDTGIAVRGGIMSQTFEHILLADQNRVAFFNDAGTVSIRGLVTTGRVPALRSREWVGLVVLMDGRFHGTGEAGSIAAITNRAGMFVRNLSVNGFGLAISHIGSGGPVHVPGPVVKEWASRQLSGTKSSLNLPVKETPEVPWDPPGDWANAVACGAQAGDQEDDSDALQQAIDSGKRTVYLPRGEYVIGKPVVLRGRVRRLIGCEAALRITAPERGRSIFTLAEGEAPVVIVERLQADWEGVKSRRSLIDNASARTLVVCDCSGVEAEFTGPGEVFLENSGGKITVRGAKVWARQIHQCPSDRHPPDEWRHLRNEGGTLWVLGNMTEGPGPAAVTTRGGQTEILGGLVYASASTTQQPEPAFVVEDGALSVSVNEVSYRPGVIYPVLLRRVVNGQPADLLVPELARGGINASLIPLFSTE